MLESLGFVRAEVPRSRRVPDLTDYFGLDLDSGRLVQVQVHDRLILGDDMTKNFRLPVESAFLASARIESVLPVPAPEIEYVVFVMRMAVKHCPLDAVLMGKGRLTRTEREELKYLSDRIDRQELEQVVADEFPRLTVRDLDYLQSGLDPAASIYERAKTGRRVMKLLAPFRRHSRPVDFALRISRRVSRRLGGRHTPGTGRGFKTLPPGGVIAFIGGDGAGKSTTVAAASDFLSHQFRIAMIHMGKPPRSLLSRVIRRLSRVKSFQGAPDQSIDPKSPPDSKPGLVSLLLNVLLARDRRRQARRARSLADAGWLVISDRYPVSELKTMDAPRNASAAKSGAGALVAGMARIERRVYDSLPDPDLRLVLRVSPDVAVSRRPEQDRDFVFTRAQEVDEVEWGNAVVLSGDEAPDRVHREAIREIWRYVLEQQQEWGES